MSDIFNTRREMDVHIDNLTADFTNDLDLIKERYVFAMKDIKQRFHAEQDKNRQLEAEKRALIAKLDANNKEKDDDIKNLATEIFKLKRQLESYPSTPEPRYDGHSVKRKRIHTLTIEHRSEDIDSCKSTVEEKSDKLLQQQQGNTSLVKQFPEDEAVFEIKVEPDLEVEPEVKTELTRTPSSQPQRQQNASGAETSNDSIFKKTDENFFEKRRNSQCSDELTLEEMTKVTKCRNFLVTLIHLAQSNKSTSPQTVQNVKDLVQQLIDDRIRVEMFAERLQTELKSKPPQRLVSFLRSSLPLLRRTMRQRPSNRVEVDSDIMAGVGSKPSTSNKLDYIKQQVLPKIMKHKYAWSFQRPMNSTKLVLSNYFDVVKRPMDLSTIQKKFDCNEYSQCSEALADFELMFSNCYLYMLYHSNPNDEIMLMCQEVESFFKQLVKKVPELEVETAEFPTPVVKGPRPGATTLPIPRRHKCQHCHKQYKSFGGLQYHLKKNHPPLKVTIVNKQTKNA